MTTQTTNGNDITFKNWMLLVDRYLNDICGLGHEDLADGPSRDSWNDDMQPEDYAYMLLEDEGFPF